MILTRGQKIRTGITAILVVLAFVVHSVLQATLREPSFFTGWLLLVSMLLLVMLNVRKKFSFMPFGKVRNWLKFHIYAGWFVVAIFLFHIKFKVPNGYLEIIMSVLFIITIISGVIGIWMSRSFAQRLTRYGEEVIFERIPIFRARLAQQADELARKSVGETESTSIADFYAGRLKLWFSEPRDYFQHLINSNRKLYELEQELDNLRRHLNAAEQEYSDELRLLIRTKHQLDYHYALQATLKGWLFVHIPLTYPLLVLAVLHLVLVHVYTGAAL